MDILAAYQRVGSFRGAAAICGTTHKTVARVVAAHEAANRAGSSGETVPSAKPRTRNYDPVAEVVAKPMGLPRLQLTHRARWVQAA